MSPKVAKTLGIIKNVFVWTFVVISVSMMIFTFISVKTLDKTDQNLFGYKFFIVQTDSMAATDFSAGDIIITKNVDVRDLKEGDIITFLSQNPDSMNETLTHKIRKVTTDETGNIAFVTYGTTTNVDDEALATIIIGKYTFALPYLGYFFQFLKQPAGYIVCILVPFLVLIISQGISTVQLFRRYKKEQVAEMDAEKEQIAKEREENQKMMEELLELKRQLALGAVPTPTPSTDAPQNFDAPTPSADAPQNSDAPAISDSVQSENSTETTEAE